MQYHFIDITADKSFSITCWVSVDDLINGQRFVSRRVMGESSQTTGYEMWGGGSSSQYYAVNTPIPGGGNIFSDWCRAGSGTTGTWMHLAMVIDRSTNMVTLYRDGVQGNQKQNSALNTWTVVNNNDIYLGCCYNVTSREVEHLMDGKLGDVRFWNKALTASFCAAGNGLKTRNGVLMFVAAMRHDSGSTLYNHVVYSNDNGETWNVSNCAMVGGDESKVVELNDGHILMSIRRQSKGARYYTISDNVPSKTEPVSWTQKTTSTVDSWAEMIEPVCNGDIARYTSTLDGYDKDRILHTVPNHATERQNVSLFLSYDEGETWPVKKTLCATGSAYSSIAILEDGTIGVYVEENSNTTDYSTYFLNVSLDWLTDNADTYTEPSGMEAVATPVFSLESGYYTEEQTLTIATETEDAQIYYTLDDTTPTTESTLYEGPITLNETVTVKAIAVKEGMSNSVMASATYTFLSGWEQPTGTIHATEDRYVTSGTTTDAVENLDYTQSSKPSTVFIDTQAPFTVEAVRPLHCVYNVRPR